MESGVPAQAMDKLTHGEWITSVLRAMRPVPLLLPSLILAGAMQRPWHEAQLQSYFGVGAGLLLVVAVVIYVCSTAWRNWGSPAVIMLHLTALGWLIFGTRNV